MSSSPSDPRSADNKVEIGVVLPPTPPEPNRQEVLLPELSNEEKRKKYNHLVRKAKLLTLLLHETGFSVHPEAHEISKSSQDRELVGQREVLSHGCDDNNCVVRVKWTAVTRYKKKKLVEGFASYIVSYEGMKDFPRETVDEFTDVVAKAATYAYFRAFYAQLDWAADLGSPPLPIYQFLAKV